MGELIDLFLDLEKKLLSLVRDLIVRPQKVVISIKYKTKVYLGAFKFYSLATSLWIVLFQIGNRYFDFFSSEYVFPGRLENYFQSQKDFAFLIAPFLGPIEFLLPFAIVNYALFRHRKFTFLHHAALNLYVGGMILLYEIPLFLIIFFIRDLPYIKGQVADVLAFIFLGGVPILYYGYVHVKVFRDKGTWSRAWSFFKPVLVLLVIGTFSVTQLIEKSFHEMLHRKILFSKFNQFDLKPTAPTDMYGYSYRPMSKDEFVWFGINGTSKQSHSFVTGTYRLRHVFFTLRTYLPRYTLSLRLDSVARGRYPTFSVQQLDTVGNHAVIMNPRAFVYHDSVYLWNVNESRNAINGPKLFTNYFTLYSRFVSVDSALLFSGFDRVTQGPMVGLVSEPDYSLLRHALVEGVANFRIDDLQVSVPASPAEHPLHSLTDSLAMPDSLALAESLLRADSLARADSISRASTVFLHIADPVNAQAAPPSIHLILSHNHLGKLREVRWLKGRLHKNTFITEKELTLYKNEFTPTPNFVHTFLHKPRLITVNDSTDIVGFQVMTDSTFAVNLTRVNSRDGTILWNKSYTIPADLTQFDQVLADQNAVYVMGRATSIFRNDFEMDHYQLPFIQVIDIRTGMERSVSFLPMNEQSTAKRFASLETIYSILTNAFQDSQSIYWNINGEHSYVIHKDRLGVRQE